MSHSVLVAEGDATELELIATVLARDGFHVVRAGDGAAAMALFSSEQVELVVCAAELPEMDGATVCEQVKRAKPETRVVLLHPSGNDIDAAAILLSRIGCDAIVPSPFRYDALKSVLADWGMRPQTKSAAPSMSFAVPAPDVTDLVAAPSIESLLPAPLVDVAPAVMPIAVEAPIAVPIPIPVVFPVVSETPALAEYAGDEEETTAEVAKAEQATQETAAVVAPVAEPVAEPTPDVVAEPIAAAAPEPVPEPVAVVAPEPVPEPVAVVAPEPVVEPVAVAAPEAVPEPVPEAAAPPPVAAAPEPAASSDVADLVKAFAFDDVDEPTKPDIPAPTPEATVIAEWVEGKEAEPGVVEEVEKAVAEWTLRESAFEMTEEPQPEQPPTEEPLTAQPPTAQPRTEQPRTAQPPTAPPKSEQPHPDPASDLPPTFPDAPHSDLLDLNLPPAFTEAAAPPSPDALLLLDFADEPGAPTAPTPPKPQATAKPDGFAGLDLDTGLDSVLDAALGDIPTARVEAQRAIADLEVVQATAPALEVSAPAAPPPPLQPTKVNFGVLPEQDSRPRQAPPPPPRESEVDPDAAGSGVRTGASSWAPSSSAASSANIPRIEARGIIEPPATPPDAAPTPPPPPREAMSEPPPPPPLATVDARPSAPAHEPRTTLPPSVPPEGDLRTLPLPRLLFELYGGTYCGTLKLTRKGIERTIDIWNGFPVGAAVKPAGDEDSLATLLRDHGRITTEQYDDAHRRAPGREAQLLVAIGVIDERDLLDVMREQTELRVAASFGWRDGLYKITPTKDPPDSALSEVHPIKAIWRGCSDHYDVGSLLTFFSTLRNRYIVATEVFPIHYPTLGPFLRRVGIADLLNGQTTFEQALRSDDTQALAIAQALYVLIVTDMVRAQSAPGAPVVLAENKPQRRQTQPVDYRELSRVCEEVAHAYLGLRERDYFEALEVGRDATDEQVSSAYERLSKPFKVENLLPGLPEDVMRRAREIDGLLRRARDTLVSPEERRRYLTRIDLEPPPPDALAS